MPADTALHTVAEDGRVMHYFEKEDGQWVCACGATRSLEAAVLSARLAS